MPDSADDSPQPIGVAIVEDDPAFREAFVDAVSRAPDAAVVGVAASRQQGMALLQAPTAAQVLLVDLGLPDGSGIDVIRAAQAAWPGCSVVVTTAFGDEQHVLDAIQAGAAGYLLKDSSPHDVMEEVRSAHRGGSPISPIIARRVLQVLRGRDSTSEVPADANAAVLSARETQVLELVAKGFAYDEIAQRIAVSRHTVMTFVRRIYAKLEVHSKMEAVNEARRKGLLPR